MIKTKKLKWVNKPELPLICSKCKALIVISYIRFDNPNMMGNKEVVYSVTDLRQKPDSVSDKSFCTECAKKDFILSVLGGDTCRVNFKFTEHEGVVLNYIPEEEDVLKFIEWAAKKIENAKEEGLTPITDEVRTQSRVKSYDTEMNGVKG